MEHVPDRQWPATLGNGLGGLRLDEIHSFLVLAEELNFSRAADRLFLSTGALSRRIARLERSLGTPLLERTTRTVCLTPYGRRFAHPARDLLVGISAAQRRAPRR